MAMGVKFGIIASNAILHDFKREDHDGRDDCECECEAFPETVEDVVLSLLEQRCKPREINRAWPAVACFKSADDGLLLFPWERWRCEPRFATRRSSLVM